MIYIFADLLLDVHHLGEYIEQGEAAAASQLASQLASKGVRLQANSFKGIQDEKEFTYGFKKGFFLNILFF